MGNRIRFGIIGSGWRAMYYVRIAQKLSEVFEVAAVVCRTPEKAERITKEFGVRTVLSPQECIDLKPDFVVVAVDKMHIAEVAMEWADYGFAVLSETPAGMDRETLRKLMEAGKRGAKLVSAEQYRYYPEHAALLKLLETGIIGTRHSLYLSEAHEYHGISLIRGYLGLSPEEPFTVQAREWSFPTVETMSRYEKYTDGRIADRKRMAALFAYANGTFCLYDFDSEQYRSPIRGSYLRLSAERGEIDGYTVRWLDEANAAHCEALDIKTRIVATGDPNPNFAEIEEVVSVTLGDTVLYEPEFGLHGLSRDEAAIAHMLGKMKAYAEGTGEAPYSLADALTDAYGAILLREASAEGTVEEADMPGFLGM